MEEISKAELQKKLSKAEEALEEAQKALEAKTSEASEAQSAVQERTQDADELRTKVDAMEREAQEAASTSYERAKSEVTGELDAARAQADALEKQLAEALVVATASEAAKGRLGDLRTMLSERATQRKAALGESDAAWAGFEDGARQQHESLRRNATAITALDHAMKLSLIHISEPTRPY